jgi:hypothetical protein
MVTVVIAMLVLIGMAGLALDMGHSYLNKSRLQNLVDAAALSAAKVLDATRSTGEAELAAYETIAAAAGDGVSDELKRSAGTLSVAVEFSDVLFDSGLSNDPRYVRVRAEDFTVAAWLIQVMGFDEKRIAASAVAGPSPTLVEICDIAPLVACSQGPAPNFGYTQGQLVCLKDSAGGTAGSVQCQNAAPGHFGLLALATDGGTSAIAGNMAGSFGYCTRIGDAEPIAYGNKVPVAAGLNTRFGIHEAPLMAGSEAAYPPDYVTTAALNFAYSDYLARYEDPGIWDYRPPVGAPERRVLKVPFGVCPSAGGNVVIAGLGCFFLREPVCAPGQPGIQYCYGGVGNTQEIFGEFLGDCSARGTPGPDPNVGPGPYIIQLYKDPDSSDS